MSEQIKGVALEDPGNWILNGGHAVTRFNVLYGGASSGKSWSMAYYLLTLRVLLQPGVGLLVLRKTQPACRKSCIRLIEYWLKRLGIAYMFNKTELIMRFGNGSFIEFAGVDDVEKLKSIEGINYIWLEEATEFTAREFLQLHIRCRAQNPYQINQLFLTFNPVDPKGNKWLKAMTDLAPRARYLGANLQVMHMNHPENSFLTQEQHDAIEALSDADPEYNKIYRLGLWATPTQIIFSNWDIVDNMGGYAQHGYGLDFGYVNPTAMLHIGVKGRDAYIDELVYETHMHNSDLIERMKQLNIDKRAKIIADSADPAYIDEIKRAGWRRIVGVNKIKGQKDRPFVATTIDRCKRYRLHITRRSTNVIEEIEGYKWRIDKDGHVMEEPVKFEDHAMDAMRYFLGGQRLVKARIVQIAEYG